MSGSDSTKIGIPVLLQHEVPGQGSGFDKSIKSCIINLIGYLGISVKNITNTLPLCAIPSGGCSATDDACPRSREDWRGCPWRILRSLVCSDDRLLQP